MSYDHWKTTERDHGEYLSRDCYHCGKPIGRHEIVEPMRIGRRWPVEFHPECFEAFKAEEAAAEAEAAE